MIPQHINFFFRVFFYNIIAFLFFAQCIFIIQSHKAATAVLSMATLREMNLTKTTTPAHRKPTKRPPHYHGMIAHNFLRVYTACYNPESKNNYHRELICKHV